jgi:hypothetical protein
LPGAAKRPAEVLTTGKLQRPAFQPAFFAVAKAFIARSRNKTDGTTHRKEHLLPAAVVGAGNANTVRRI